MKTRVLQRHPQRRAAVSLKVKWEDTADVGDCSTTTTTTKKTCSGLKTGHLSSILEFSFLLLLRICNKWLLLVLLTALLRGLSLCSRLRPVVPVLWDSDAEAFLYWRLFWLILFQKNYFPFFVWIWKRSEYCWINLNHQIAISKHSTFLNLHILSFLL